MPKCHKCKADFSEFEETCPYCGTVANVESITDIMDKSRTGLKGVKMKKKKTSKSKWSLRKKKHGAARKCDKCGAALDDNYEICPECGLTPGVETITSILDKNKGE